MSISPSNPSNSNRPPMRVIHGTSPVTGRPFSVGDTGAVPGSSEFVRGNPPISFERAEPTHFTADNRAYLKMLVVNAFRHQQSPFADNPAVVDAIVTQLAPGDGDTEKVRSWKQHQIAQLRHFDPLTKA